MFKELHPNIRARILIQFLSKVIGSMIFPFMAIYFANALNSGIAGVLVMIHVIFQFISGIYGGHLTDLLGRRRLMIIGEWVKVIAYLGMLLANSPMLHSAWITFIMMLAVSIAQGMINPAADAMLIDVSTPKNRAFMYSISYWANNLSILIGVMIGGWFFQSHFFLLLIALFILSLVTTFLTITKLTETMAPTQTRVVRSHYTLKSMFKNYQQVMIDKRFLLFTIAGIAIMSVEFQRNNYISVRLAEELQQVFLHFGSFGAIAIDGIKLLSLLTAVNTLMIVLFTGPIAKFVTKRPQEKIMYIGFGLFTFGYAITAFSNQVWLLFTATVVFSIGELLYVPTRQTILAAIIDQKKRGSYMAFNGIIFQLGKLVASLSLTISPLIGKYGMATLILLLGVSGILITKQSLEIKTEMNEETV